MPTLGEACSMLRISRRTLDKWLERLGIEPARHPFDYRFYTITDEQVAAIRETRAQMPQMPGNYQPAFIPSYSTLAFDRRQSGGEPISDVSPTVTATPRQRPLQRGSFRALGEGLSDGMMSRTDVADLHNFPRSTLRRWCEEGRIETSGETFGGDHGHFIIAQPVTAHGLRQFYALASHRPDFQRCPDCPHDTWVSDSADEKAVGMPKVQ